MQDTPKPDGPEELLTVKEVMARAKLGRTKIWAELRSGALASIKLGRSRRIPISDYARWISR